MRRVQLIGFSVGIVFAAVGCDSNRTCGAVGCLTGVNLHLNGTPPAGHSYHVVIATDTQSETVPLVDCTLDNNTDAGTGSTLRCNAGVRHSEYGTSIDINDTTLQNVHVTITDGTTVIADQKLPVSYSSSEINGPGCGVCTEAQVDVDF